MTLNEFFVYLNSHPGLVLFYFLAVPSVALLLGWITEGEGHVSPWSYLYSGLVYAICIPGIFAVALGIYLFLFERGGNSIFSLNLLTQALPVVSMLATLGIIRRNTPFEYIPGFGKLSSLMTVIVGVFVLMYILERTRLFVWINMPVHIFLLTIVGLVVGLRFALKSMLR
jgi:hypothetical protein